VHPGVVGEAAREALGVASLAQVVELRAQRPGELAGQSDQVVVGSRVPVPTGTDREVLQDLQFTTTSVPSGSVAAWACPDRRGGERLEVERREDRPEVGPELLGDHLADDVSRHRWRCVLELDELGLVGR
jgi:hypothetical protein